MVIKKNIDGKEVEIEITSDDISRIKENVAINYIYERIMLNYGYEENLAKELAEHAYWAHFFDKEYPVMYECMEIAVAEYKSGALTIKLPCENDSYSALNNDLVEVSMAEKSKRNVAIFRKSKYGSCLVCNCSEETKIQNITIKRFLPKESLIGFDICDDCLKLLEQDIADYYKK